MSDVSGQRLEKLNLPIPLKEIRNTILESNQPWVLRQALTRQDCLFSESSNIRVESHTNAGCYSRRRLILDLSNVDTKKDLSVQIEVISQNSLVGVRYPSSLIMIARCPSCCISMLLKTLCDRGKVVS